LFLEEKETAFMSVSNIPSRLLARLIIPTEPCPRTNDAFDASADSAADRTKESFKAMILFLEALRSAFPPKGAVSTFTIMPQPSHVDVFIGDGCYFLHAYLFRPDGTYAVAEEGERFIGSWRQGVADILRAFIEETQSMIDIFAQRIIHFQALESLVIGDELQTVASPRANSHVPTSASEPQMSAES
jgi:hypothetical protein